MNGSRVPSSFDLGTGGDDQDGCHSSADSMRLPVEYCSHSWMDGLNMSQKVESTLSAEDPFRHHPGLRGKITPADQSFFRDMDLDLVDARAAEAGRPAGWRTPCEIREAERQAFLDGRWNEDLWVFGYGSLMWDPAMDFIEVRRSRTDRYSRSFCLWDEGGRGSVERPGLMLAIDQGPGCEGLAFRISADKLDRETFILFRREMIARAYEPVWLMLETELGPLEALTFAANHENERIVPGIPMEKQAGMIAGAEGFLGTNHDYLANVHKHLDLLGVRDPYISELYARVEALRKAAPEA